MGTDVVAAFVAVVGVGEEDLDEDIIGVVVDVDVTVADNDDVDVAVADNDDVDDNVVVVVVVVAAAVVVVIVVVVVAVVIADDDAADVVDNG